MEEMVQQIFRSNFGSIYDVTPWKNSEKWAKIFFPRCLLQMMLLAILRSGRYNIR